jgi:thymidylate kinase
MLFLDSSPEELLKRVKKRNEKEMFETRSELIKVRKKALALVKDWIIIDTSKSIHDTFFQIKNVLDSLDKNN